MTSQPDRLRMQVLLCGLCFVLLFGLVYRHRTATTEKAHSAVTIARFSNQWVNISEKLHEQKLVNLALERNYTTQADELKGYSNALTAANLSLSDTEASNSAAAKSAQQEIQQRDQRIAQLETDRDGMTQTLAELSTSISSLETRIVETEEKLQSSTADREFLTAELARLRIEKADLERQFQDLAVLRQQIRKLRDELSVSRRLAWIRRGAYGDRKGAELLRASAAVTPAQPKFNLDVEVRREQAARVLPTSAQ